MTTFAILGMQLRWASCRMVTILSVALTITSVGALAGQSGRDTLVHMFSLTVPDSVPLTRVEQLVPGADGSVFMIDSRTEAILAFDAEGAFRTKIGAKGKGPGELLSPWRLGLLGQDTLWVVDASRPRLNLYNAFTGASLADLGPAKWGFGSAAGEPLRPIAVLADHRVVSVGWAERDVRVEVLVAPLTGRHTQSQGVSLASLNLRDRHLAIPVPNGDGTLRVRDPFSHTDMLAIDPSGRYTRVIRRPKPVNGQGFFTVERNDVLEGIEDTIRVPYTPRPVQSQDVRTWADGLGAVERMVELRVFPSRAAGVNAVLNALGTPDYHPPIRNRGRGIVDDGVLVDSEGRLWSQLSDVAGPNSDWVVVSGSRDAVVTRVSVPKGLRLLAVQADRVWAEAQDDYGVPIVHVLELRSLNR